MRRRLSQKQTNKFVLFAVKSKKANKTSPFICFLGIYGASICFQFYLTFKGNFSVEFTKTQKLASKHFTLLFLFYGTHNFVSRIKQA